MYARVVRWEGADGETVRRTAAEINQRAATGPPEGMPPSSFRLLVDPDEGRALGVAFFDTEEDLRRGHEVLEAMSPPGDGFGRRTSVEMYEVAVDVGSQAG